MLEQAPQDGHNSLKRMDFWTIMVRMTHIHFLCSVVASVVLAGTWLATPAHAEDSMRCGSRLVSTGDGKDKVRTLCGEPSDVTFQGVIRRAPRHEYGYGISRYEYYGPGVVEMPVQSTFGSDALLPSAQSFGSMSPERSSIVMTYAPPP